MIAVLVLVIKTVNTSKRPESWLYYAPAYFMFGYIWLIVALAFKACGDIGHSSVIGVCLESGRHRAGIRVISAKWLKYVSLFVRCCAFIVVILLSFMAFIMAYKGAPSGFGCKSTTYLLQVFWWLVGGAPALVYGRRLIRVVGRSRIGIVVGTLMIILGLVLQLFLIVSQYFTYWYYAGCNDNFGTANPEGEGREAYCGGCFDPVLL